MLFLVMILTISVNAQLNDKTSQEIKNSLADTLFGKEKKCPQTVKQEKNSTTTSVKFDKLIIKGNLTNVNEQFKNLQVILQAEVHSTNLMKRTGYRQCKSNKMLKNGKGKVCKSLFMKYLRKQPNWNIKLETKVLGNSLCLKDLSKLTEKEKTKLAQDLMSDTSNVKQDTLEQILAEF
ncbi:hypothetical protein EDI_276850 [Entamoeba dispar SAW760]|uniref:Uncharacterized protein n=1 Tax=Entamoeba dispar (strain ATCC PRA-260 / SAW760) TaxID=370354 RepID=B0EI59_ENTDS|nr:uncharacterized protein EDI_276850 [Entamoeba dispar SAW760]EDR25781.1 hypothetical protein EDI_276850 [Entamoeba dispar SAW760]|eukprot:EDR25781.1 hypothetical protein EDI_276850 [Entamoeba dispar SAW760]